MGAFVRNPDTADPELNSQYGIYQPNCGFDNCLMSYGHDEYLYHMLKGNGCTLPREALYIIRFHSFYPWHKEGQYGHLASDFDRENLKWLKEFQTFDLYSKSDAVPNVAEVWPYYEGLLKKYGLDGVLRW